jgi:hypothetical protein
MGILGARRIFKGLPLPISRLTQLDLKFLADVIFSIKPTSGLSACDCEPSVAKNLTSLPPTSPSRSNLLTKEGLSLQRPFARKNLLKFIICLFSKNLFPEKNSNPYNSTQKIIKK